MITSFYGFKLDQFQTFDKKGERLVVTRLKTNPLEINRVKLSQKDGYWAYQVAIDEKNKNKKLREIKTFEKPKLGAKEKIKVNDVFKTGDKVSVTGITKGKGFAGVVKRWHFAGGPKTHGQSDRERAPGSIGQGTNPGRVWKGKKMPGRMGNKTKIIKGLKVFKIDDDNQEIWLTGLVPGARGGLVKISKISKSW